MKIPPLQSNKAPFKIIIKPRSKAHADLITKTCAFAASPDAQVRFQLAIVNL